MSHSPRPRSVRRAALAVLAVAPLAATALSVPGLAPAAADNTAPTWFERTSTYPVYENVPAGVDPADGTVAEIAAVSPDGNTVAYTDAVGGRIGFVDIADPAAPEGLGTYVLGDGSPTSVAIVDDHALVVVDESDYPDDGSGYGDRAGRLEVITLADQQQVVPPIDLGGQPDSIAISPDGAFAAIAMENQRNELMCKEGATITVDPEDIEDSTCSDGELGDLPQGDPGDVVVLDLTAPAAGWTPQHVALPEAELAAAGLNAPGDAEPEYVDINDDNQLVVTLQENNGFAVIDLATTALVDVFSTGTAEVTDIDDENDGVFDFSADITEEREPDSVQWVGDGLVATANEGDWLGGSRGWSVFDAGTGEVVWDAGSSFEHLAAAHGHFNNDRADNKGSEPEGLAFAEYHGTPYAFVGSERSNFVAVYDMTDPAAPEFTQLLPTTMGPEGLLPIPQRDLLVVSSEEDDAPVVRAAIGVYTLGSVTTGYRPGIAGPSYPSIVSDLPATGAPIAWSALGALSADPADPQRAFTASDAAVATPRIYGVDVSTKPAIIDEVIEVTGGETPVKDIEGLVARKAGGFWVANEGSTGAGNFIARTDATGVVQETVPLDPAVAAHVKNWGLEGVTATGSGDAEAVYVVVQRPLWVDPTRPAAELQQMEGNVARIGRYVPATDTWSWFTYPLETTTAAGDWIGLSEITAIDADSFAVIERDKLNGPAAAVKRVYRVDLSSEGGTAEQPVAVRKKLAYDMLPVLEAKKGWTQEKLEGLTITGAGQVLAVTDNDGLSDNAGETHLCTLGSLRAVFGHDTTTKATVRPKHPRKGRPVTVTVTVRRAEGGTVVLKDGRTRVGSKKVDADGVITFRINRIRPGTHRFRASYGGSRLARPSTSAVVRVVVKR